MISDKSLKVITRALEEDLGEVNKNFSKACAKLLKYAPGFLPDSCVNEADGFEPGDERAPFFSEAYLYNLLGKNDARTLLALMRPVWKAAGIKQEDQP